MLCADEFIFSFFSRFAVSVWVCLLLRVRFWRRKPNDTVCVCAGAAAGDPYFGWIIVWNKMPNEWLRLRWQQNGNSENVHRFVSACRSTNGMWHKRRHYNSLAALDVCTLKTLYRVCLARVAGSKCDDLQERNEQNSFDFYFCLLAHNQILTHETHDDW